MINALSNCLMLLLLSFTGSVYSNPPDPASDEYADYVLRVTLEYPDLTQQEIENLILAVRRQISFSNPILGDSLTALRVEQVIVDAIVYSPTFRRIIIFSRINRNSSVVSQLEDIVYGTSYTFSPSSTGTLTPCDIYTATPATNPIQMSALAFYGVGVMNVGITPNMGSIFLGHYNQSIIHEMMHLLTASVDPPNAESVSRHGPTELLAERVIRELGLGYSITDFTGYGDPQREIAVQERNFHSLRQFFQRTPNAQAALNRIIEIGRGHRQPPLFRDYVFFYLQVLMTLFHMAITL